MKCENFPSLLGILSLCGCVCIRGQKNIDFSKSKSITIDGRNLVGLGVVEVGESESGCKYGFKGQKIIDFSMS